MICDPDPTILEWDVDWNSDKSLKNWYLKFDLICAADWKKVMPGAMYFIGLSFTTTWLPPFSDMYGRKSFFLVTMFSCLLFHLGIYFTTHWSVVIVMALCIGLVASLRVQVGFNYLIELFPKNMQVLAGSVYCVLDGIVYIITVVYFWKISNDWSNYFLFVFVANLISLIGTLFLPESPRMLADLGKKEEIVKSLE